MFLADEMLPQGCYPSVKALHTLRQIVQNLQPNKDCQLVFGGLMSSGRMSKRTRIGREIKIEAEEIS
jgi:hypothetical protein